MNRYGFNLAGSISQTLVVIALTGAKAFFAVSIVGEKMRKSEARGSRASSRRVDASTRGRERFPPRESRRVNDEEATRIRREVDTARVDDGFGSRRDKG